MKMRKCEMAVTPGDGIGIEVIGQGVKVIETVEEVSGGFKADYTNLPLNFELYKKTGQMMPEDGVKILADHLDILFGERGL
jgi:tartrate dehydrogenase/decarboxylase/D-malate dehydrogenase